MSAGGIVRQVDPQHQCQHQQGEETDQQDPGPGHPRRVTAAAVALMQGLVPPTRPGHDSEIQRYTDLSAVIATCPNWAVEHVGGKSKQEVEQRSWL